MHSCIWQLYWILNPLYQPLDKFTKRCWTETYVLKYNFVLFSLFVLVIVITQELLGEFIFSKSCGHTTFQFAETHSLCMHSLKFLIFVNFPYFTAYVNHQKQPSKDFLQKRMFSDKLLLWVGFSVPIVRTPEERV